MKIKIFKVMYIVVILLTGSNAWEVNTHRAIDRTAIELSMKESGVTSSNKCNFS